MSKIIKTPPERIWRITLTEEQMCVLIEALDDWHRFMCGQCSMDNATSYIATPEAMHRTRDILDREVKPAMFPELALNASYSWNGGHPDPAMNRVAAMSYMLYREMRHRLTLASNPGEWNVYKSETLRCREQGALIKVELIC